ncbi:MAG: DinB family protein [Gemmatimonadota bacterium]|nr:DinB family protein [Gemmatimonadota bacterium]
MDDVVRLLDQLDRSLNGDSWHGPALLELLPGIDAATAAARPIAAAHSIRELVAHSITWQEIVTRRLRGDDVEPTPEENFPTFEDVDGPGWSTLIERLVSARAELRVEVEGWSAGSLDETPVPGRGTRYHLVHGVIQHDLYHAGQVALLARAASE